MKYPDCELCCEHAFDAVMRNYGFETINAYVTHEILEGCHEDGYGNAAVLFAMKMAKEELSTADNDRERWDLVMKYLKEYGWVGDESRFGPFIPEQYDMLIHSDFHVKIVKMTEQALAYQSGERAKKAQRAE